MTNYNDKPMTGPTGLRKLANDRKIGGDNAAWRNTAKKSDLVAALEAHDRGEAYKPPLPTPTAAHVAATTPLPAPTAAPAPAPAPTAASTGVSVVLDVKAIAAAVAEEMETPAVDLTAVTDSIAILGDRVAVVEAQGDAIRDLANALKGDKGGKAKRARTVAAATKNPVLSRLIPYYAAGEYNGGNIVSIESPAGFGKSHAVREMGRGYDVFLEHGCSEDIDEISTLLGSITPDGKGGFITVDGVMTEAFRAASSGKNVLLLLDAHLRWSARTQEFVLVTFTPCVNAEGKEVFRLRTRKPDGDTLEVLEAPVENLHFISASNLEQRIPRGPYWDRFLHVRLDFDKAVLAKVCRSILDCFGVVKPADGDLAKLFADKIGETRKAAAEGKITYPLSPRDLKRGALFAADSTESSIAQVLTGLVRDKCQSWDADTGDRIEDGGFIDRAVAAFQAVADKAKATS